ncbi:hypothetical protein [Pseudooceanicola aestuarii]|uniref:hypothetical protein n=1 Tax=Pseudooceanicola aestuarii TaxID=2697319 RepID=UPI0013D5D5F2|nr:hypothetical protein [Pseudooceanicola aestuarii]
MDADNSYRLSGEDIILSVGPHWDAFATKNNAPGARSELVLGQRLWAFVTEYQTQLFLSDIFFACRMDMQPFQMLYRCDAPTVKRLFRLTITPELDGALRLDHRVVLTRQKFLSGAVAAFADHYDHSRCSICCAFLIGENWVDTFARPDERYFARSYAICPDCRSSARNSRQQGDTVSPFSPRPD